MPALIYKSLRFHTLAIKLKLVILNYDSTDRCIRCTGSKNKG